jgi:hypothetical protein
VQSTNRDRDSPKPPMLAEKTHAVVSTAAAPVGEPRAAVTARAVILGLFGGSLIAALQMIYKINPRLAVVPLGSVLTLLQGPVFWLFLVALANVVLRRFLPRAALRPGEFAVIYGLSTVAAGIAAQDQVMQLWPMFVFPFRKSQELTAGPFRQFIPPWVVPQDPAIVEPYYLGGTTFWTPERVGAFVVPFLCWMTWLAALGATMWAWNVILRRRWVDQDRLSFPSMQLPLEICRAGGFGGQVAGPLFWTGAGLAAVVESLAQLHARWPSIPEIPLGFNAGQVLNGAPEPWNALSPMYLDWSTIHLGICWFIPLDILFSGWFFYLFRKALEVFGFSMGWRQLGWDAGGFPYTRSQAAGAWIALFFLLVWAERRHLVRVLASAFSRRHAPLEDADEPAPYSLAGRVLVFGTVFLIAWSMASGMSLGVALAFYGFFWMLHVTMTRVYAQVGPPYLELYFLDPQRTLTTAFGTLGVASPRSLTLFSLMYWFVRTDRGHPMGHQLASFYIAGANRVRLRSFGKWVLVAFLVGCVVSLVTYLHWVYRVGEDQFVEGGWRETFSAVALARLNQWVHAPKGPQWTEIAFMLIGAGATLGLAKASYTFVGLPFHPIGYALAMVYTLEYNWPAFLTIWAVKGLLLRYGGRALFMRVTPLFLGVVLAGLVTPVVWGLVAWVLGWNR